MTAWPRRLVYRAEIRGHAFWMRFSRTALFLALGVIGWQPAGIARADSPASESAASVSQTETLHDRIDELIERHAIGPLAPLAGDADFVRRVHLDLTGIIPTVDEVREFLADPSPNKRQQRIERLLNSPDFARHFAVQLNVVLLDRRAEKYVDQKAWESYLIEAIQNDKPLDELFRELIAPSLAGDDQAPPRKFLLTRDAEPHAMTRDVGRLLFGMDLQCAQCHDHPLISDYHQEDYYGLFAFLNRTSLFEDPTSKAGLLAEKADGEAAFESVFTGDGKPLMRPRVPRGSTVHEEPAFSEDDAYRVKPDKANAAKPVYSRREALASQLADSSQFRRTIANRLWALLTGRGLIHPTDFDYADNPPINPELLSLLADALAEHEFDLRHLVREVLLSRAYQRDCEPPGPETVNLADVRSRLDQLTTNREQLLAQVDQARDQSVAARSAWQTALDLNEQIAADLPKLEAQLAEARQAAEVAEQAAQDARLAVEQVAARATPIETVLTAARSAVQQLGEAAQEPALTQSLALLEQRAAELADQIRTAEAERDIRRKTATAAVSTVQERESELAAAKAKQLPAEQLASLEQVHLDAFRGFQHADASRRLFDNQIKLCQTILEYPSVSRHEPDRAESLWQSIVEQWTLRGQVAPLKPLTPEQLAASAMRATGMFDRSANAAKAALEKAPPAALESATDETEKQRILDVALQVELLHQLRGSVNQFVSQFGGLSGEEFQASVNQALFLGNSPTFSGWLGAGNDTLIGRLKEIEDVEMLADELSMAVLSRPATIEERREIAEYLNAPADSGSIERSAALAEWVWALLTSNEFRFNH